MRVILSSFILLMANWVLASNIATVTPIAYSMTSALTVDTDIEVTYLPPTRLPINRIPSWLNRNSTEPMPHFDALVNISSLRPELSFYKPLRTANVRIVPIDIAQALIPGGEQVAISQPDEYFWLNTNNALLMLGILKRDLMTLWPDQATQIARNFQETSTALRQFSMDMDNALLASGYDAVSNAKPSVSPFSKGLMLPTLAADELDGLNAVTIHTKADNSAWQIDDFSRYSAEDFISRWRATLNNLPTP